MEDKKETMVMSSLKTIIKKKHFTSVIEAILLNDSGNETKQMTNRTRPEKGSICQSVTHNGCLNDSVVLIYSQNDKTRQGQVV